MLNCLTIAAHRLFTATCFGGPNTALTVRITGHSCSLVSCSARARRPAGPQGRQLGLWCRQPGLCSGRTAEKVAGQPAGEGLAGFQRDDPGSADRVQTRTPSRVARVPGGWPAPEPADRQRAVLGQPVFWDDQVLMWCWFAAWRCQLR